MDTNEDNEKSTPKERDNLPKKKSPLDIAGVDLDVTTDEIVNIIREGRERYG